MIKAIFLLRRKPGITHAQFRDHYEKSHVKLAHTYLGHLMISYERNYCTETRASRSQGLAPATWDYDCITEWILPNREALDEVYRLLGDPVIGKFFYDDEEHFLARDGVVSIVCEEGNVVNNGTGGGHGTLALKGK